MKERKKDPPPPQLLPLGVPLSAHSLPNALKAFTSSHSLIL